MVVAAVRGALGFLSRVPVGHDERAWNAFRTTPVAFPLSGYLIGSLLVLPLLLPVPEFVVATVFLTWLYAVTGINHLDGVADLGDALVVHGDTERRREVLKDTTVGVGALLAVCLVVLGAWSAGAELAGFATRAAAIVVAAEVSAKLAVATVVCLGTAAHEGLGSALTSESNGSGLLLPIVLAVPAGALTWPDPAAAVTLLAGAATGLLSVWFGTRQLGGVSGDLMGASNECARVVALLVGVTTWTL